jgi:putative flavoprotein involved in K+ transport
VPEITTVVIGAGHCGLAMSRCLAERSIDHVVLEQGETANSWRTQRWNSFRMLTPNWMTRLPGFSYRGDEPDAFMAAPEVVQLIDEYAAVTAAPVLAHTKVTSVRPCDGGYLVRTDQDSWQARSVVLASGACTVPVVPALQDAVPADIAMLTPAEYRSPDQLPSGGALVVGASASGIQIAEEIHRSGRAVTLAVGEHVRMPRTYRGLDILWWMDAAGVLDERYDEVPDIVRARALPSMQLIGSPNKVTIDLNALTAIGVRLVGRLAGIRDENAQFSGSLRNICALADLKLGRLLDTLDAWALDAGVHGDGPAERFATTKVPSDPPLAIDLRSGEIRTIIWATGFRPDLSWLDVPVLDRKGRVVHEGGVTAWPGLYLIGMPFLRRRKSSLIDGAASDARDLTAHLAGHLDSVAAVTGNGRRHRPQEHVHPRLDAMLHGR